MPSSTPLGLRFLRESLGLKVPTLSFARRDERLDEARETLREDLEIIKEEVKTGGINETEYGVFHNMTVRELVERELSTHNARRDAEKIYGTATKEG